MSDAFTLKEWAEFWVIVGTSGAALTGLMFVAVTLSAERGVARAPGAVGAFATPTVVHFFVPLLLAGTMTVPWRAPRPVGVVVALLGVAGTVYVASVIWRALRQHDYHPVLEDWIFHGALPPVAYLALAVSGAVLPSHVEEALLAVGGAAMLLLLVGVHNSWDTLTWFAQQPEPAQDQPQGAGSAPRPGDR